MTGSATVSRTGGATGSATTPVVVTRLPSGPMTPIVARTSRFFWAELHRCLLAGGVLVLTAAPAAITAWWGLLPAAAALLVLPMVTATGLARFCAALARGDRPGLRVLARVDVVLGLVLTLAVLGGLVLAARPGLTGIVGQVWAAMILLVLPWVLSYGAVRGRTGPGAVRGGLLLVVLRPSWALTVLALGCLAAFATAASAGVLALLAPAWTLAITCAGVTTLVGGDSDKNRTLG